MSVPSRSIGVPRAPGVRERFSLFPLSPCPFIHPAIRPSIHPSTRMSVASYRALSIEDLPRDKTAAVSSVLLVFPHTLPTKLGFHKPRSSWGRTPAPLQLQDREEAWRRSRSFPKRNSEIDGCCGVPLAAEWPGSLCPGLGKLLPHIPHT